MNTERTFSFEGSPQYLSRIVMKMTSHNFVKDKSVTVQVMEKGILKNSSNKKTLRVKVLCKGNLDNIIQLVQDCSTESSNTN